MSIYLEHHGILGQKWGKRNGPPYPLDESDRSARERRLEGAKKLAKSILLPEPHKEIPEREQSPFIIGNPKDKGPKREQSPFIIGKPKSIKEVPKDMLPSDFNKMPKDNKIVKDIAIGAGIAASVAGVAILGQKLDLWYWAEAPILRDIFDTKFTVEHENLSKFLGITW